jgi:hypothetical protein
MSILIAVMGIAVSIYLMRQRLEVEAAQRDPKGRYLLIFAFCCSLVLGAVIASQIVSRDRDGLDQIRRSSDDGGSARDRFGSPDPDAYSPSFKWGAAIALGSIGFVALAYMSARGRVRRSLAAESSDEALEEELAALLDATLDDLRAEPDPRRAVIAAYARMERALAAYGLPRHPFEAPLEFLERAAPELAATHPGGRRLVFELTHLFERAKFSQHAVDEEMKRDAIATLEALRDDLRGGPL